MANNEEVLQQSLKHYEEELSVVLSALDCDPNSQDLIELKTKLIEIIALTEVDLIGVKKANLLSQLETNEEPMASTSSSATHSDCNDNRKTISQLVDTLEELNGNECRVAFTQQNGSVGYHNGIVMTSEVIDAIEHNTTIDLSCIKIKVFFTHPMNNSMLPCPHYMSSKCRYSSDKCKYSHGYEVSLEDIKPFEPKDYSRLSRDSVCLAKNESDGLWHKSIVDDIREQQIVVKYCDSDFVDSLDIEDILPLNDNDNSIDENNCDKNVALNDDSDEFSIINWNNSSFDPMAKWEAHTKGIGSKLMTKMGYVMGQGLGKNGEGITKPIDVFVFPNGKSLDACLEFKEKYLTNDELRQKIRNKEKKIEERIADRYNKFEVKDNVFDFINSKILSKNDSKLEIETKDKRMNVSQLKASNTKSLNISSVKISEDIRRAEFDLKRLSDSLVRNKSKDKALTSHLLDKIERQKQLISSLKNKELMIQREQKSRSDKQKLVVF